MFSWPAYYSALFSLPPLTEELELKLLGMTSQNAMQQYLGRDKGYFFDYMFFKLSAAVFTSSVSASSFVSLPIKF